MIENLNGVPTQFKSELPQAFADSLHLGLKWIIIDIHYGCVISN